MTSISPKRSFPFSIPREGGLRIPIPTNSREFHFHDSFSKLTLPCCWVLNTIHDTMVGLPYIYVRPKATNSQLNLPHRTKQKRVMKTLKTKKPSKDGLYVLWTAAGLLSQGVQHRLLQSSLQTGVLARTQLWTGKVNDLFLLNCDEVVESNVVTWSAA